MLPLPFVRRRIPNQAATPTAVAAPSDRAASRRPFRLFLRSPQHLPRARWPPGEPTRSYQELQGRPAPNKSPAVDAARREYLAGGAARSARVILRFYTAPP